MSCRGYVYPVVKLIRTVLCPFTLYICWVCLVIRSYKLFIDCCIDKVTYIRLLNLLKYVMSIYITYLKDCVYPVIKIVLSIYFILTVESTENATSLLLKGAYFCRWASGEQVGRGVVGMHGIVG